MSLSFTLISRQVNPYMNSHLLQFVLEYMVTSIFKFSNKSNLVALEGQKVREKGTHQCTKLISLSHEEVMWPWNFSGPFLCELPPRNVRGPDWFLTGNGATEVQIHTEKLKDWGYINRRTERISKSDGAFLKIKQNKEKKERAQGKTYRTNLIKNTK